MLIGEKLKFQREMANLTQQEVAKQTGISQQTLSRWENDMNIPNIMQCWTLAKYYGITLEELIGCD